MRSFEFLLRRSPSSRQTADEVGSRARKQSRGATNTLLGPFCRLLRRCEAREFSRSTTNFLFFPQLFSKLLLRAARVGSLRAFHSVGYTLYIPAIFPPAPGVEALSLSSCGRLRRWMPRVTLSQGSRESGARSAKHRQHQTSTGPGCNLLLHSFVGSRVFIELLRAQRRASLALSMCGPALFRRQFCSLREVRPFRVTFFRPLCSHQMDEIYGDLLTY